MRKAMTGVIVVATLVAAGCNRAPAEVARAEFAEVTIGILMTTGGKGGGLASATLGAAGIAARRLAEQEGVEVVIHEADYQGDLSLVGSLARGLVSTPVDLLIVGTDDPAVLTGLSGLGVPMILPYITSDGATALPDTFRLAPTDSLLAQRLATYLVDHREYDRIGLLSEKTSYGAAGSQVFPDAVSRAGGLLVMDESFETGGDIHTSVMLAEQRGADALVIWTDDPAESARVVIDVHRSALSYQIVVAPGSAVPEFGKNAVAQVVPTAFREGILSAGPWAGPWLKSEKIRTFYSEFESAQNETAPVKAAQAFDAVVLASKASASEDIVQGLGEITDFVGASVPVTFDARRNGMDLSDVWIWGFTKSEDGGGSEFFPAVDTGGGFFTLITNGLVLPQEFGHLL